MLNFLKIRDTNHLKSFVFQDEVQYLLIEKHVVKNENNDFTRKNNIYETNNNFI